MGMVRPCSGPRQQGKLARGVKDEEHAMSHKLNAGIAVIGIDTGVVMCPASHDGFSVKG
jgi:hypothetical protein